MGPMLERLPPPVWTGTAVCPNGFGMSSAYRRACMRFALDIGEREKNLLEFNFNQLLGSTVIKVNGKEVKKSIRLFSEPLQERHELEVGTQERHTVFIEKRRKLLFGQKFFVYINQRLVKAFNGI